jgi:carboxyl-terminal processing protease
MRFFRAFALSFGAVLFVGLVFLGGYLLGDHRSAQAADPTFGVLWDVQNLLKTEFLGDAPAAQAQAYGAAKGLVESYKDPYTVFVEPAPRTIERDELRGHFGGIGANMGRNEAGDLVLTPMRDGPAAKAGLQDGDILLAVDGEPITAQMTVDEIVALVRGDEGTAVKLSLRRAGRSEPFDISVVRARINVPSVDWRVLDQAGHLGYIKISIIGEGTAAELRTGIDTLAAQGVDKLIVDLRGNGGGLVDSAVDIASQFLKDGVVLREQQRGQQERFYPVKAVQSPAQGWKLALLVDGSTASAAEIIAGALHDYGRATLIGDKTYGKGSVQRVHELADGSSLHVTVARWLTPNRHQIDKVGLQPDLQVSFSDDDRSNGRDPQLARAQAFLLGG